ncbi:hypothetical protein Ocin01_12472 [Orchesella cincta]|uniref:Transmembrane protein n=1 Tax=Orchesella cincta TaxID=48709 RepID=A0A1D2MMD0_ORCCI|nr:hypothetical protein Ocin01_12472 [Orchesella cincta]
MLSKFCPRKALPIAVKFVALGDAVWSILLCITVVFGAVVILSNDDDDLGHDMQERNFNLLKLFILGLLTIVHLWAASFLYKYVDNQRNRVLWPWFLVTAVIIIVFSRTAFGAEPELEGVGDIVLFSLVTIVYKFLGVAVVAAFKKEEMRSFELFSRSNQNVPHGNSRIP